MTETREGIAQEIWDSWQDTDSDDFFVGGATRPPVVSKSPSLAFQLAGISSSKDLLEKVVDPEYQDPIEVVTEEDSDDFVIDRIDLVDDAEFENLFFFAKKRVYERFDYMRLKSENNRGVPLTEKGLVLSSDDYYVIEYFKTFMRDYFAIQQLAELTAYMEMGISFVRFRQVDGCPLCNAHDGLMYSIPYLMDQLQSSASAIHPYCECKWDPVIHRERYSGVLGPVLNIPEVICDGVQLLDVPREWLKEIQELVPSLGCKSVQFVNMVDYGINDADEIRDTEGVVVIRQGDALKVHFSYVGCLGPVEFLAEYCKDVQVSDVLPDMDLDKLEVYYYNGRRVYCFQGHYWDVETKSRLA
jgi:hypothetical protein